VIGKERLSIHLLHLSLHLCQHWQDHLARLGTQELGGKPCNPFLEEHEVDSAEARTRSTRGYSSSEENITEA
jgi:hypothetical protein